MTEFPTGVYTPRTKENKSGVVYDANKPTVGFAEDITKLDDEVVAIENTLGVNPQGAYATVKAWLTALAGSVIEHNTTHQNGGVDEISVEGLSGELADNQPPKAHSSSHDAGGSDELTDADIEAQKGLVFFIDGGGSAITTGIKGGIRVPFKCEIVSVSMLTDQSGSIVVDIWKDTYENYPPTDADTITASAPPTITSSNKVTDSTLTDWTKGIAEGDFLMFNVDSITTVTWASIVLKVKRVV